MAEFSTEGRSIASSRRVTPQTWPQLPESWTVDSRFLLFNSDRAGITDILKTDLLNNQIESLVSGPGKRWNPQATSDGRWIYFWSSEGGEGWPRNKTLKRIPASGGAAESIRLSDARDEFVCSQGVHGPCFLFEAAKNPIPISRMDLANGRFTEIANLTRDHLHVFDDWAPSPDGSKIALLNPNLRIQILHTATGIIDEPIPVREGLRLRYPAWLHDESALLAANWPSGDTLNLVQWDGNVQPLLKLQDKTFEFPRVSPDGKHIAFALNTLRRDAFLLQQK